MVVLSVTNQAELSFQYSNTDIAIVIPCYMSMYYMFCWGLDFGKCYIHISERQLARLGFALGTHAFNCVKLIQKIDWTVFLSGKVYFYTTGVPKVLSSYVLALDCRKIYEYSARMTFCLCNEENTYFDYTVFHVNYWACKYHKFVVCCPVWQKGKYYPLEVNSKTVFFQWPSSLSQVFCYHSNNHMCRVQFGLNQELLWSD